MIDTLFLFSLPGGMEWILIFLAVLLLFGGRKIPELMKGLGRGIREFNDARDKVKNELEEGARENPKDQKESPDASDTPKKDTPKKDEPSGSTPPSGKSSTGS